MPAAMSSNDSSDWPSNGAGSPPAMTSTPSPTEPASSSAPSSPGYANRRHALAVRHLDSALISISHAPSRSVEQRGDLGGELGREDDVVDESGTRGGDDRLGFADGRGCRDDARPAQLIGPHPDHAILQRGVPDGAGLIQQDPADLRDHAGLPGAALLVGPDPCPPRDRKSVV